MIRITLLFIAVLTLSICSGQSSPDQIEGKSLVTGQRLLNDTIKKNETIATDYIGFYQKFISSIRGQECPMYPSCSNYGLKTFSETDFISAFIMTSDRLLRCGHDHHNYSLTLRKNGFKFLDYPAYDSPPKELYYYHNSYYYAYSDTIDDTSFHFIKKLINNQYCQEALLEIMRIEFQKNSFNVDLFINKIICLKATGEYEKALFEYEMKCPKEHKYDAELEYQIALIHYKLQNFDLALKTTSQALESCTDSLCKPKIISLNGLIYANKFEWSNAMQAYKSLSGFDSYQKVSNSNLRLSEMAIQIKSKNPSLAGFLSIIPGAGYAYAGHRQTAISAFLINGLMAYATYSNFKNKNYGMGILTGIFNLSFYIGNIYGAAKSTNRYNEKQRKSIIDKLEFNTNF